ncbi:MAG: 6-bladed beta-propeller [Verrucomicrobia bacterium]|nr:6-bladed beta-propeller [Verrucomicrobiota bacterium]
MLKIRAAVLATCFLTAATGLGDDKWPELPYKLVADWPALPAAWNFGEVPGVAVDAKENVYVFNRSPHPLMQFTSSGKFLRSLLEGMVTSAHGVRIDHEGNIWVADHNGHTVLKLNPAGRIMMVLGRRDTPGTTEMNFNRPTDVAVAPTGEIYVSDGYGNSRVMKFSRDGRFLAQWGKKGSAPGEFNLPHSIVLDAAGQVYVADRENHRIQIFTPDGKFVKEWKGFGSPWGLAIAPNGEIFMADGYANRVLKLAPDGRVLGALGSPGKLPGQFAYAHHLAVGKRGELYVAEILNWRVQKFVPE